MKKLHLVCGDDDLRPAMKYIQIKNGTVSATNSHIAIRLPVEDVIKDVDRNPLITHDEEMYFLGKNWQTSGMYKAAYFKEEGDLVFAAFDKNNNVLGIIRALSKEKFASLMYGSGYPDITAVFPNPKDARSPVSEMGIGPKMLLKLSDAFGGSEDGLKLHFYGESRPVMVTHIEQKGYGLIMPLLVFPDPNI